MRTEYIKQGGVMQLDLFRGAVKFVLTTRAEGNFQPMSDGFIERIEKKLRRIGAEDSFSLRTNFTNIILEDSSLTFSPHNIIFLRSNYFADAMIIEKRKRALIIHNADCPVGILFDVVNQRLCLVHLGLKNLYRPDGSISTLEAAVRAFETDPREILFWFGGGIQRCCYGCDENKEELRRSLKARFGYDVVSGFVEKGPSLSKEAIDLFKIIFREALRLKLNCRSLTAETTQCTSCLGTENNIDCQTGTYWSNVRDPKKDKNKFRPRSAAIAMIT